MEHTRYCQQDGASNSGDDQDANGHNSLDRKKKGTGADTFIDYVHISTGVEKHQ